MKDETTAQPSNGNGIEAKHELVSGASPAQANWLYLAALCLMLAGSILLMPRIGVGFNTCVNELVFFLLPVALLARRNRWRWRDAYALRPAPAKAIVAAALAGIGLWVFNATLSAVLESALARYVGPNPVPQDVTTALNTVQTGAFLLALVVLAPFCEEVFFRGMMQTAYTRCGERQALIGASVLFGLYHALNGVSQVIPATFIGFALGYCALKTGSVWPGIALHAVNNGLAGLAMLASKSPTASLYLAPALNPWTAMAGLGLALLMMQIVKVSAASRRKLDATKQLPSSAIWRSVPLWIAIAILCIASVVEIASRAGVGPSASTLPRAHVPQGFRISAEEMTGSELPLALIQVPETPDDSSNGFVINLRFSLTAGTSDMTLALIAPDGSIAWTSRNSCEGSMTIDGANVAVPAHMPGEWRFMMDGRTTEVEFSAEWEVSAGSATE